MNFRGLAIQLKTVRRDHAIAEKPWVIARELWLISASHQGSREQDIENPQEAHINTPAYRSGSSKEGLKSVHSLALHRPPSLRRRCHDRRAMKCTEAEEPKHWDLEK